jgi:hypothetical protein
MLRRTAAFAIALALAACKGQGSGPVLAKGDGIEITADEFRAHLEDQQPFQRAQLGAPGKKKAVLNRMVQEEILFHQAEKEGLRDDPQVQKLIRTFMVQRLMQRHARQTDPATVPAGDVDKYYEEHASEYQKRVAGSVIAFLAAPGAPERGKKRAAAEKALAELRTAERKAAAGANPQPASTRPPPALAAPSVAGLFAKLVTELSDDDATKRFGGSLGFKTRAEHEKSQPPELVEVLFGTPQNSISNVIETPKGYYIVRVTAIRDALGVDQVRPQIQVRLARQKDEKTWTDFVQQLQTDAKVVIDEKALEAVEVAPVAPPGPGHDSPSRAQPSPDGKGHGGHEMTPGAQAPGETK